MSYEAWGEPDDSPFDAAIEAGWINPVDVSKALLDVMNERDRQWNEENFDPKHDDQHQRGELASAACSYVLETLRRDGSLVFGSWPAEWDIQWFKPTTPRRNLVKAAALLIAEIERLDRAEAKTVQP